MWKFLNILYLVSNLVKMSFKRFDKKREKYTQLHKRTYIIHPNVFENGKVFL